MGKWNNIKSRNIEIRLHMIGKLQSNKVKNAVSIFDYIHSVDSLKLAKKIAEEQQKQKKNLKIFIQVNVGDESQKNGVRLSDVDKLVEECKNINLDVAGLMCLPPIDESASNYFSLIKRKNDELALKEISLGMSNDYLEALSFKTTFIRVGSKIFGERN